MPGGPKSWAQLNGKPVVHEGGKCACGVGVGGRGGCLFWAVLVGSLPVLGLKLCGIPYLGELLF